MKKIFFYLLILCLGTTDTYARTLRTFYDGFGPNDVTNDNITTSPDINGNYGNNATNTSATAPPVYLLTNRKASPGAFINIPAGFSPNGINNGGLLAPGTAGAMKMYQVDTTIFAPNCPVKDVSRIAIMGSSVPSGTGATNNQGYAQLYARLLTDRANRGVGQPWNVSNISIPGNNTINVINRWDKDLLPLCSKYVVYALSLGNEGITTGGQAIFNQFRDNLKLLINKSRQQGIEPIITNCYSREDYTATEYKYIKQMNLLIHSWDVASVNLSGALDNGSGRWATGYKSDDWHPNDAGHLEFEYAIVPSLFDALKAGKPQPCKVDGTSLSLSPASKYKLQIRPEEVLHSFTLSYDIQTSSTGQVAEMSTVTGLHKLIINASGKMDYFTAASAGIPGVTVVNDNQWHKVTLTHYYALGKTLFYVDKVLQGAIDEKIVTTTFDINGVNAPAAKYRTLLFYRSGMTAEEINAMVDGNLLKSSLEIYSPLDGASVFSTDPIVNLAQSTNKVRKVNLQWTKVK